MNPDLDAAEVIADHIYGCEDCGLAIVPTIADIRANHFPDYCDECSERIESAIAALETEAA